MLTRRTPRHHEPFIAARPVTATLRKYFCWALALALGLGLQLAYRRTPLAITPALFPPAGTPVRAAPIRAAGTPAPPTPGRVPTRFAAIACLRMRRPKPLFAALQQTASPSGHLPPRLRPGILELDHGRACSPTVKSRSRVAALLRGVSPPRPNSSLKPAQASANHLLR